MKPPSAYVPGIRRLGAVLAVAGAVGYAGLSAIKLIMPLRIPDQTRADKLRLSHAPQIQHQQKAPAFLDLTNTAAPARIPNFYYIEPASTRERLLQLAPGTEITVVRPAQPSIWFAPFDIIALRVNDQDVLSAQATAAAHSKHTSGSQVVTLYIAVAGVALFALARLAHAA